MHVVTEPPESILSPDGSLEVLAVPAATDNLVWVVRCVRTGATAVVDGPSATEAQAAIATMGATLQAVWNTHIHGDHIGINRALLAAGALPAQVIGPAAVAQQVPGLTHAVDEGDVFRFGDHDVRVLRTDGHIFGHVSYLVGPFLFCGDTLFAGGCGRVFDSTHEKLFHSLLTLAGLPEDTWVCCAHEYTQDNLRFAWSVEPDNAALAERIRNVWRDRSAGRCVVPSTIAEERATNPFLRPGSPSIVAAMGQPEPLAVFTALRLRKDAGAYKAIGDAGLPLG